MVLSMARWEGKVALVTGASSGIGASIAEHLVRAGLKVIGVARRKEQIQALSDKLKDEKGTLYAVGADLSIEGDIIRAFEWVTQHIGPISILVNNAGLLTKTSLIDGDTDKWKKVIDVNVLGLCICTREAIRSMRKNSIDGHIVHINSITGHKIISLPGMNIYPASKHAVTALTELLRVELRDAETNIKVSSVSPGYVITEIFDVDHFTDGHEETYNAIPALQGDDIAEAVVYVLSTPPHVQIHELTIKPVREGY